MGKALLISGSLLASSCSLEVPGLPFVAIPQKELVSPTVLEYGEHVTRTLTAAVIPYENRPTYGDKATRTVADIIFHNLDAPAWVAISCGAHGPPITDSSKSPLATIRAFVGDPLLISYPESSGGKFGLFEASADFGAQSYCYYFWKMERYSSVILSYVDLYTTDGSLELCVSFSENAEVLAAGERQVLSNVSGVSGHAFVAGHTVAEYLPTFSAILLHEPLCKTIEVSKR
jgi:hypothetical protein